MTDSRKLDWSRTRPGRGGFDEAAGAEWRKGPSEDLTLVDGDENTLPPGFLEVPGIYWSTSLARAFPEESADAHEALKKAATSAASRLYSRHSINTLISRTLAFYERASASKPFPSAYFAAYFDFACMRIALSRIGRHDPPPRRKLKEFYSYGMVMHRCRACSRGMVEREGGFRAFADRVLKISGEGLTTRGFTGP